MSIEEFLKNVYNFISWMNVNVFEPLNGSVRIDAFVGIVGILVAIVIFIAETMNDRKVETQKRFVLEKTKMKSIMIFSIHSPCLKTYSPFLYVQSFACKQESIALISSSAIPEKSCVFFKIGINFSMKASFLL